MARGERSPRIIDCTLREGCQAPGVRLGIAESVEITGALVALGVDMIECGHPASGDQELSRVRAVAEAAASIPVLAHARAREEDIEAVYSAGVSWIGIFLGINDVSRSARIRPAEAISSLIRGTVAHARARGLKVRFTIEDGSRTPWPDLCDAYRIALEAGAQRVCLADTVGRMLPWEVDEQVKQLVTSLGGAALEVHFHDDRGLASSNALMAVRAGAQWVSTSVNGIGERCGIADTLTALANFSAEGWRSSVTGASLQRASALVQAHARLSVDRWRPIVGANAATHVARLHRRAVNANPKAYAWIDPKALGLTNSTNPPILPPDVGSLINTPNVVSATELRHHRHGPGDRYLMLDNRVVPDARQYCIVRDIPSMPDHGPGHVDEHRHVCDSSFLFLGREPGLCGLAVEVKLGGQTFPLQSPSSVFIPAGVLHSYRVTGGSGLFVNHVMAGTYEASLLDTAAPNTTTPGESLLNDFFSDRLPGVVVRPETVLADVLDSLVFLDLFIHLEAVYGAGISLDSVSACSTRSQLVTLLDQARIV